MSTPRYLGTDFSSNLGMSYKQYCQLREFTDPIQASMNTHARALVQKNDQLIAAIGESAQGTNARLADINLAVSEATTEIADGFDRTIDMLRNGFGATVFQLSHANETLDTLLRVATSPAETWACEQHWLARDAYRRRLFPESLEALDRAIGGHGSNVGWQTQHRFHLLKGVIQLGDQPGIPADLIDPEAAEASFVAAARYSRHDEPVKAADALLLAGRAAYAQLEHARAERHFRDSLDLHRTGEAVYQLAKALAAQRKDDEALAALETAIRLASGYVEVMKGDREFEYVQSRLDELVRCLNQYILALATAAYNQLEPRRTLLDEARLTIPSSWTLELPQACPEEFAHFNEMLGTGQDPTNMSMTEAEQFLQRVATEAASSYEKIMDRWNRERRQAITSAQEDIRFRRESEIAEAKRDLLKASGVGEGILIWLCAAVVFVVLPLGGLATWAGMFLVAPLIGAGGGYFIGQEARESAQERLEAIGYPFDLSEAELSEAANELEAEVNVPLAPRPDTYLFEWRDGDLHCSNVPTLSAPSKAE